MTELTAKLAANTGLSEGLVIRIMLSAPIRYKEFYIPKRNGQPRLIAQPAREVKLVQRALIEILLNHLPVHPFATAYRAGYSTRSNAIPHSGSGQLLKFDFKDFFPSIRRADWINYCRDTGCLLDESDIGLTSYLLFRKSSGSKGLRLAIGAPSSPALSNILMFDFDRILSESLSDSPVVYTRYADDLTFSAPRTGYLTSVRPALIAAIKQVQYPRLSINPDKTTFATTKYKRFVTGLVLANDGRVTIGKSKKRWVHAAVHRAKLGHLNPAQIQALSGYLAYVKSVEPTFLATLSRRYGADFLKILQGSLTMRKLS